MYRKIVSLMLIMTIILSVASSVYAATTTQPSQDQAANTLKDLGLFMGTNNGFELDRAPTRTEAIVLLLRMLGKEQEAKDSNYTHPFTDVPAWADKHIAYAYNKGLTSGTSISTFGGNDTTTPEQFFTFTLRALGYNDKNGDFTYQKSINKAVELGLASEGDYSFGSKSFVRGDCASTIYNALDKKLNGSEQRLIDKLVSDGVVAEDKVAEAGFVQNRPDEVSKAEPNVSNFDTGFTVIRGLWSDAIIYIEKSKLPAELKEETKYLTYGSVDENLSYDEVKKEYLDDASKRSFEDFKGLYPDELSDTIMKARHHVSNKGKNPVIALYDKVGNLIGLRIIHPEDYVNTDSHYMLIEVTFSVKDKLSEPFPEFTIKRYVNGVEDTSFDGNKIEGCNPCGSSGTSGVQVDYKYTSAPLFIEDSSVTYEYIDLKPEIKKNISKRVYDWEYLKSQWPQFVERP